METALTSIALFTSVYGAIVGFGYLISLFALWVVSKETNINPNERKEKEWLKKP